jgi:hypothetical protein
MKTVPILVYITKVENEPQEYRFYPEERVLARGGIGALEYDEGETCSWFSLLGEIQLPSRRAGPIRVPIKCIQHLVDSWQDRGAPKQAGWRVREREVKEAVRGGLKRLFPSPSTADEADTQHAYDVQKIEPQQFRFSQIVKKLDAGEVVDVQITFHLAHHYRENNLLFAGFEEQESRVWIWREKTEGGASIRAEVIKEGRLAL